MRWEKSLAMDDGLLACWLAGLIAPFLAGFKRGITCSDFKSCGEGKRVRISPTFKMLAKICLQHCLLSMDFT